MNAIAFVFSFAPHGTTAGREGLDAVLATSALSENIALFFISDGVLQLIPRQQPEKIYARNYSVTFGVLSLYDVKQCYVCLESLVERGLSEDDVCILSAEVLNIETLRARLERFDRIVTF